MNARLYRFALSLAVAIPLLAVSASPAVAKDAANELQPQIEMAILLDTSGSMSGLIDQTRTQIWTIVNQFATATRDGRRPLFHVALYEYGKSSLPAENGFMRQIVPLTDDLDKISEELFKLQTNGGSEHCGQVIDLAVKDLKWSESDADLKFIFIAGNEPFTQGPVDFRDACKAAIEKGIMINTIFCGDHDQGVQTMWAEGAKLADGSYASINQNQVVPHVDAPQDEEIAKLNGELNKTYIAYGSAEKREEAKQRQVEQDQNAAATNAQVAAQRAATKASSNYLNYRWDLCDAVCHNKVKIEDVPVEQLPEELQKMTIEQRKEHIEAMIAQRKEVQEQIVELNSAREKYVADELKKLAADSDNTLDRAIIAACREQARRKNFDLD